MSEFTPVDNHDVPPAHEPASTDGMLKIFQEWARGPEHAFNDPKITAFGEAASYLIANNNDFRGLLQDMLSFRNEPETYNRRKDLTDELKGPKQILTDEIACNLTLRAMMLEKWKLVNSIDYFEKRHLDRLEHFNYDFLKGHEDPNTWIATFLEIVASPRTGPMNSSRFDDLAESLSFRVIQSNKPERYKGAKIALDRFREVLPQNKRIVEIGSSLGEGIKKMMWGISFSETEIELLTAEGEDPEVAARVRAAINRPANIEYAINNDLFNFTNPNDILWVLISSHYPREFEDKDMIYEFLNIARSSFPNLGFAWGNAANEDFVENIESEASRIAADRGEQQPQKPNVALLFTVMYECSDDELTGFYKNLKSVLDPSENSMIIIQDLIEPDADRPFRVSLSDNFRIPGRYRLAVIFPFSADPAPIFLGEWDSARCNKFTMYPDTHEYYSA